MKTNSSCSRALPSSQRMAWHFFVVVDNPIGRRVYTSRYYRSFERCRLRSVAFLLECLRDVPITGYGIEYSYVSDDDFSKSVGEWSYEFED